MMLSNCFTLHVHQIFINYSPIDLRSKLDKKIKLHQGMPLFSFQALIDLYMQLLKNAT